MAGSKQESRPTGLVIRCACEGDAVICTPMIWLLRSAGASASVPMEVEIGHFLGESSLWRGPLCGRFIPAWASG